MKVTTKELRIQPGKIIEQVVNGQEITVTFRGKALAKIVPLNEENNCTENDEISIIGLWKDYGGSCKSRLLSQESLVVSTKYLQCKHLETNYSKFMVAISKLPEF